MRHPTAWEVLARQREAMVRVCAPLEAFASEMREVLARSLIRQIRVQRKLENSKRRAAAAKKGR